ncbi:phospholipid/cholesterol/gamma-HCH transport system ATP-binding protein [Flavobacterium succinicans]|uniref:Phospholipid/cholesterol/gamma-HCH transport system ATP-binding protein n=1 Tax=Flavobacterium succinicans TaxID=29536 RepID=A0A1I4YMD2_9FLAO|nr:ATP-binding cassette domain-containing protein [Flavobacterium succinicans]SFN38749.1 phospholipid/cholesterol/gamma-HCH transport system ATP-binding protein [Flavobacterium succinicans]
MKKEPLINIENVWKSFKKNQVLKGLNLSVNKGESLVILGRSGSGKSVCIKCIVGLIKADKGQILVFGSDVTKLKTEALNKIRIRIGFMFQNGALYDSMSVRDNLAFTLKHHTKDLETSQIEEKTIEALEAVGLSEAIDKMPSELSGGMRKRVGLARTLIIQPEIILYDEPTSGLDTITAREISKLIVSIQKKQRTTSIIITHDMACAKATSDRIMILNEGVIHAEGTYSELENSNDEWVKSFFI